MFYDDTRDYVKIFSDGYIYYDCWDNVLYNDNDNHYTLMNFLYKDLEQLQKKTSKYIESYVDKESFGFKPIPGQRDTLKDIQAYLISIHPYFEIIDSTNFINNEILRYLRHIKQNIEPPILFNEMISCQNKLKSVFMGLSKDYSDNMTKKSLDLLNGVIEYIEQKSTYIEFVGDTPYDCIDNAVYILDNNKPVTTIMADEYKIESFNDLLYLEAIHIISERKIILECDNCGRLFIAQNKRIKYCNRITNRNLPCNHIGKDRKFNKKIRKDEALREYMRAYKRLYSRINAGTITYERFTNWRIQAKKKLNSVREGKLHIAEFITWLDEYE